MVGKMRMAVAADAAAEAEADAEADADADAVCGAAPGAVPGDDAPAGAAAISTTPLTALP